MAEERRDGADWRSSRGGRERTGAEMGAEGRMGESAAEMRGASTEQARGLVGQPQLQQSRLLSPSCKQR